VEHFQFLLTLEAVASAIVAAALDIAPEMESKTKQIAWMGGALNVPGNRPLA
jgi:inosine-uridine nucleoside N-ribohydrolase